ncbi:MAG TPA: nicotinamide riboside transporter PnuC [Bacteroidales bacterium]|nr:nicotinamide riboside transporter PnuC [Bacteroidales bacterium]
MDILSWFQNNIIEIFGSVTGIIYVFLEIRQNKLLWPVGIVTSGVYIWVFLTSKFYADMSLQVYYLVISLLGWYWWSKPEKAGGNSKKEKSNELHVSRLRLKQAIYTVLVFVLLYGIMWVILSNFTDSPVPEWDSFLTSLSIIATWMLARKIYEHWFIWIVVNSASAVIFFTRGLFPTVILYFVYAVMSVVGLFEWKKSLKHTDPQ